MILSYLDITSSCIFHDEATNMCVALSSSPSLCSHAADASPCNTTLEKCIRTLGKSALAVLLFVGAPPCYSLLTSRPRHQERPHCGQHAKRWHARLLPGSRKHSSNKASMRHVPQLAPKSPGWPANHLHQDLFYREMARQTTVPSTDLQMLQARSWDNGKTTRCAR